ncbi:hypothetical protein OUZ56_007392 [Daphnia magna]|uniref:Uncharacterized protein n=1 Tax=Daphnia magna TaxID=35525 RepID=A0ABR0A9T7_9CRUS|nr:hypothetical protein OUZ56_007392 [Daphnia magna]
MKWDMISVGNSGILDYGDGPSPLNIKLADTRLAAAPEFYLGPMLLPIQNRPLVQDQNRTSARVISNLSRQTLSISAMPILHINGQGLATQAGNYPGRCAILIFIQ